MSLTLLLFEAYDLPMAKSAVPVQVADNRVRRKTARETKAVQEVLLALRKRAVDVVHQVIVDVLAEELACGSDVELASVLLCDLHQAAEARTVA
jgi:hypothetical protein